MPRPSPLSAKASGQKGPGRVRRKLDVRLGHEIQAIRRELYRIFFWAILDEQRGDSTLVGPEHGFVARIGHRVQR